MQGPPATPPVTAGATATALQQSVCTTAGASPAGQLAARHSQLQERRLQVQQVVMAAAVVSGPSAAQLTPAGSGTSL